MSKKSLSNGVSSFRNVVLVKNDTLTNLTCTGKKESPKENLGPGIGLKMTESLQYSHCVFLF